MVNGISVHVAMTERCNLKCIQCDLWKSKKKRDELSSKQWMKIFIGLRDWLGHSYQLNIGGGEPFIRKDLVEIIEFCSDNDIRTCVITNATLLEENSIKILSKIETLTLNVSLDGVNSYTHNYLRGENVYQRLIEVLRRFKTNERKCRIGIATVLMGYNFMEIMQILNKLVIVDKLADGLIIQALWIPDVTGKYDREWYKKSVLWPLEHEKRALFTVIDELIESQKKGMPVFNPMEQLKFFKIYFDHLERCVANLPCDIGNRNFILNPKGEVLLCWNLNSIGDILKERPEDIWNSLLAEKRRKEIENCNKPCRILNCNFKFDIPFAYS